MAAVLSAGTDAVLSHRSAAALWGPLPLSSIAIEVTRPTSVPRTLFDLSAIVNRHQLESAFNEVEVQGLTDSLSVMDLSKRYPGRRGAAVLRAIMADEKKARGVLDPGATPTWRSPVVSSKSIAFGKRSA